MVADFVGRPLSLTNTYILLECEPLDIKRKRVFESKQPGEEEDAGLGYKTMEQMKFMGLGRP